jgi:hypothetical protein
VRPVKEVHHILAAAATLVELKFVEFVVLFPRNEMVFFGGEALILLDRTLFWMHNVANSSSKVLPCAEAGTEVDVVLGL